MSVQRMHAFEASALESQKFALRDVWMIGNGCASVLKTYFDRGSTESSSNSKYRYFSVSLCIASPP